MSKRRLDEGYESDTKRRMVEIQELFAALPEPAREQLLYELRDEPETIEALCMASREAREYCAESRIVAEARETVAYRRAFKEAYEKKRQQYGPMDKRMFTATMTVADERPWESWNPALERIQAFKDQLGAALIAAGVSPEELAQSRLRIVDIQLKRRAPKIYMVLRLPYDVPVRNTSVYVEDTRAAVEVKQITNDEVLITVDAGLNALLDIGASF